MRKKIMILACNEHKWKSFVGDEVKAWVGGRLEVWIDKKPERFADYRKSTIPDWAVYDKELLKKLRSKKVEEILSKRKCSSAFIGK